MISQNIIEKVKAINIENVISDYISLKKQGVNFSSCCPFHDESTSSFIVSPAKGMYKCFGCGKGGNVINFVMEHDKITFPEAVRILGRKYGIEVPETSYSVEETQFFKLKEKRIQDVKKQSIDFQKNLVECNSAKDFLKSRFFTDDDVKYWQIGWASNGYFAERITFPIHNYKGEIVGFTGRTIANVQPKYKNSPDSEIFKKGELLFGFHQAKQSISKKDKCYLVEGQTDVISMHRKGITNTVASSGTALSKNQIQLIKRFSRNLTIMLDADKAGIKAALKDITPILKEGMNLMICLLPEGDDPDSFITKYGDAIHVYIEENKQDFISFKASIFAEEIEKEPVRKGELVTEISADIALVTDKNVRRIYIQKCAHIFGIKEQELTKDIRALREKLKEIETGTFFGLDYAQEAIKEANCVNILSHNIEVIEKHLAGKENFIGIPEMELTKEEILKLKTFSKKIILTYDFEPFSEKKEEVGILKNLKKLFTFGFDIRIIDESNCEIDEETGDVSEASHLNFVDFYIRVLTSKINIADSAFTGKAINLAAEIISYLPESIRITKISNIQDCFRTNKIKFNVGDFKKILATYLRKNAKTVDEEKTDNYSSENNLNLTKEQMEDLNKYQHYFGKNAIHHIGQMGNIQRISNFTITPIIHSNNASGHFKLFEMVNEFFLKVTISLDTKDLNDVKRFKCKVEEKGNFVFKGNQFQLDNIKERLYTNTTYSNEVECLGWQYEGFFAWADGITKMDGTFEKTDKNGLIQFNKLNYLIKPYSSLYLNDRTSFINEKKFHHKTSDISFNEWYNKYFEVFGSNAMISTCALITCFYSEAIFKLVHGELPLINYFGPKGAGKTQQADSLLAFFGEKQPVNNLSKVTIYGLSQTLKSFQNAFVLIDEYKNSLDIKWIEFLKSAYNRQGKIQGNLAKEGTKTEHIPINSMVLLCGQDLPTLDVALLDRCICLTASKTEFTDSEKTEYKNLKNMEEQGLAHITDEFLKHREFVIENFEVANNYIQSQISSRCGEVSGRLQKNLNTLLTPFYILREKMEFAFTFDDVLDYGCYIIKQQQKFIESADDLKNFWTIFQTLLEQNRISEGRNYMLHDVLQINYLGFEEPINYSKGKMILFLRWDGLYPLYAEYARRSGMIPISEKTLQFYLEKSKYFVGKIKAKRFSDRITKKSSTNQAHCFDYDIMNVSLSQSDVDDPETHQNQIISEHKQNELPF